MRDPDSRITRTSITVMIEEVGTILHRQGGSKDSARFEVEERRTWVAAWWGSGLWENEARRAMIPKCGMMNDFYHCKESILERKGLGRSRLAKSMFELSG